MVPAAPLNEPTNDESHTRAVSGEILMLATLVTTATYAVGFNPPGGVCQDTNHAAGHLPGDPTLRSTDNIHYQVFFYANAAAFASSLMVVVLTLLLTACHKDSRLWVLIDRPLRCLMLAAMLAFTAAYVAGACRDKVTLLCFCGLMGYAVLSGMVHFFVTLRAAKPPDKLWEPQGKLGELELLRASFHKFMVPLSTFALTITYTAGHSTPGGFWDDDAGSGHRPGDAILKDRLDGKVLRVFFICNSTAFVASLYGVFALIWSKLLVRKLVMAYFNIGLLGLVIAYIIGSSRGSLATVYVVCFLYVAVVAYIVLHVAVARTVMRKFEYLFAVASGYLGTLLAQDSEDSVSAWLNKARERRRASDLVLLLAGLALGITYQAGLYPPGGLWPANVDGHMAGDPILQTIDAGRYNAFYYCNSLSFVASLVAILLVNKHFLHEHHALQAAMIVDSLGLIAAYAIGSCRDQASTLYAVGLAGAAVVYVVVHVSYFALNSRGTENEEDDALASVKKKKEKMGGRSLLLAILVASITYQAGLTPPGGFLLEDDHRSGHHAGDPVLLYNYPRRYRAFFYCNTVSFIMSIVLILLHVNPTHYKPAKRSDALSTCSAVSFICLMGAFAAGGTQHMKGSIYIFFLAALAFILCLGMALMIYREEGQKQDDEAQDKDEPRSSDTKRNYLVTLGILVASVTYQAGLDQPGGSWQSSSDGHDAGNPVMHDNSRQRYLTFFCANSASFVASVYLIALLMLRTFWISKWCTRAIDATVVPQCMGLLLAYASGSSRQWTTSVCVGTLVAPVLAYVVLHVTLSAWRRRRSQERGEY